MHSDEEDDKDHDYNWTEVLGSVAAAINSQAGWGKNDVSVYEALFGQVFDHQYSCSKEDACKCWTVDERMLVLVANDTKFDNNVAMDYDLRLGTPSEGNAADMDEDDSGYFSDNEVPADETEDGRLLLCSSI